MRNITVSVSDEVYRRARIRAAELDTSVSRLVSEYLAGLSGEEDAFERLRTEEHDLRERIESFSGSNRLSREALHDRG
ncbi:MAG TPA: hypothetical protein VFD39_14725 [Trueperaceae bacterium]|nr:hypothetical protein [Trueperaceae bacterium]